MSEIVRAFNQSVNPPTPFLFRGDNDQREVILKSTAAEADHFLRNCGEQLRGTRSNVVPAKLKQSCSPNSSPSEFIASVRPSV
jgi:hypothetical protein